MRFRCPQNDSYQPIQIISTQELQPISTQAFQPISTAPISAPANETQVELSTSDNLLIAPSPIDPTRPVFRCKICGYTSNLRSNHSRHLKNHQKKPYKCDMCPRSFPTKTLLDQHDSVHRHRCKNCSKQFNNTRVRRNHERQCRITNLKCPQSQCDFRTINSYNLKRHMLTHTTEKPFQCKFCPQTFKCKSSAVVHMRRIHKMV